MKTKKLALHKLRITKLKGLEHINGGTGSLPPTDTTNHTADCGSGDGGTGNTVHSRDATIKIVEFTGQLNQ